jgi:hypothetical protein
MLKQIKRVTRLTILTLIFLWIPSVAAAPTFARAITAHVISLEYALPILTKRQREGSVFLLHQDGTIEKQGSALAVAAAPYNGSAPENVAYVPVPDDKPLPSVLKPLFRRVPTPASKNEKFDATAKHQALLIDEMSPWHSMLAMHVQPANIVTYKGSGPYRRIFTNAKYSYLAGNVFLPCKAGRMIKDHEVGFIYFGGWGDGLDGSALDVGFQHSSWFDGSPKDNYSLFIFFKRHQLAVSPRLKCGQRVAFTMYPLSSDLLEATAYGMPVGQTQKVDLTELAETIRSDGWVPSGGSSKYGVEVKRTVSIGQKSMSEVHVITDTGLDGSFFGHTTDNRRPLIAWSQVTVGTVDAGRPVNVHPWGASETFIGRNAPWNYPSNGRFIVKCANHESVCADESDAIDLSSH